MLMKYLTEKIYDLTVINFAAMPCVLLLAFSALTLLVGWQEGHLACKNEWWGTGMVICLERMAQLMSLPLTVSCFSKIQIGFTFLVPAHPGSSGKRAVKWVCVCTSGYMSVVIFANYGPYALQRCQ